MKLSAKDIENLEKVKLLIEDNLHKRYTAIELSVMAAMSISKFRSAFRYCYGSNVFTYLKDLRLQLAFKLTADNDIPVKKIASRCGYAYTSHLHTAIRKKFGLTVSQIRKGSRSIKK